MKKKKKWETSWWADCAKSRRQAEVISAQTLSRVPASVPPAGRDSHQGSSSASVNTGNSDP